MDRARLWVRKQCLSPPATGKMVTGPFSGLEKYVLDCLCPGGCLDVVGHGTCLLAGDHVAAPRWLMATGSRVVGGEGWALESLGQGCKSQLCSICVTLASLLPFPSLCALP